MNDVISIIISTYKRSPDTIKRAINSILNQTYAEYEIILVDDNPDGEKLSEKDLSSIKLNVDNPFKYVTYEGNRGACHARNIGAGMATGKYLAFLDDDDEWLERKLELQINCLSVSDCVMATCDLILVQTDNTGKTICEKVSYTDKTEISIDNLFNYGNIIGGASFPLIRKDAFDNVGGFTQGLKACQDIDLWIRLLRNGNAVRIPEPLVKYHWHPGTNISYNWDSKTSGTEYLVKTHSHLAPDPKMWMARQYNSITDLSLSLEKYDETVRYILKSFRVCTSLSNIKCLLDDFIILVKQSIWYRIRYKTRNSDDTTQS